MSHKKNRSLKCLEGLGYVTLSVCSALATVVLGAATVALAMSIVGIPLAVVTVLGTGACAAGTFVFAERAGHKFGHAFGSAHHHHHHHHEHYVTDITSVPSHFDQGQKDQKHQSNTVLNNQNNISGSTKPFFSQVSPISKGLSNAPEVDNASSAVFVEPSLARASV